LRSCRRSAVPVRVLFQQLDVETVEAAGGLDVKRILADLLDRGDARQRQEEAEVVVKVGVSAGDGLAINKVFGLKGFAVGGEDEFGLGAAGGRTLPQRGEGGWHFTFRAGLEMDVDPLEYRAGQIRARAINFQPTVLLTHSPANRFAFAVDEYLNALTDGHGAFARECPEDIAGHAHNGDAANLASFRGAQFEGQDLGFDTGAVRGDAGLIGSHEEKCRSW
jgi:hypothetical protein